MIRRNSAGNGSLSESASCAGALRADELPRPYAESLGADRQAAYGPIRADRQDGPEGHHPRLGGYFGGLREIQDVLIN